MDSPLFLDSPPFSHQSIESMANFRDILRIHMDSPPFFLDSPQFSHQLVKRMANFRANLKDTSTKSQACFSW